MFRHLVTLFLIFAGSSSFAQIQAKWSEGEHLILGLEGSLLACGQMGIDATHCPSQRILRADKKITYKYGEIVTSADFYNTPEDFYNDTSKGIAKIIKCAYNQKNSFQTEPDSTEDRPDCTNTAIFNSPGYLEVVSHNYNHFGWNNMVAYVENHNKALALAKKSYNTKVSNPIASRKYLDQALVYNGYADHYLTDAFAAGHIRVPRVQIKNWSDKGLSGAFRTTRGDLLTMVLHNKESQNLKTNAEEGLRVQNSRGDGWYTRSDGNLNYYSSVDDPASLLPKMALVTSFTDILEAWMFGEIPEGIFAASWYVPFEDDMPLVDKFTPAHQQVRHQSDVVNLLYAGIPFYERLIFYKSDVSKLLDNLASIFVQFRKDIAVDQAQKPELKKRLPSKYLNAYLNVE